MSHYLVLPQKKGELLIIDGDPEVGKPCMFGRGMYLYVFFFCVKDIYIYVCRRNRFWKRDIRS